MIWVRMGKVHYIGISDKYRVVSAAQVMAELRGLVFAGGDSGEYSLLQRIT